MNYLSFFVAKQIDVEGERERESSGEKEDGLINLIHVLFYGGKMNKKRRNRLILTSNSHFDPTTHTHVMAAPVSCGWSYIHNSFSFFFPISLGKDSINFFLFRYVSSNKHVGFFFPTSFVYVPIAIGRNIFEGSGRKTVTSFFPDFFSHN